MHLDRIINSDMLFHGKEVIKGQPGKAVFTGGQFVQFPALNETGRPSCNTLYLKALLRVND